MENSELTKMHGKALIYSEYYYPMYHGVPVTSRTIATQLCRLGKTVAVFTTTDLGHMMEEPAAFKIYRKNNTLGLLRFLCSRDLDYIIIKGSLSLKALCMSLVSNAPLVLWHEMADPPLGSVPRGNMGPAAIAGLKKALQQFIDLHVGITNAVIRSKKLGNNARSVVIYNSVADYFFQAPKNSEILFKLGYVGRINAAKGALIFMEALSILDARGFAFDVCFAGAGEDLAEVMSKAKLLNGIRCSFLGVRSQEQLVEVYDSMEYLVLPSYTHMEGMGLVGGEAIARGVPVIASNQDAIVETLGAAGIYFKCGDAQHLAKTIDTIQSEASISHTQMRTRCAMRAPMFRSEYQRSKLSILEKLRSDAYGIVM